MRAFRAAIGITLFIAGAVSGVDRLQAETTWSVSGGQSLVSLNLDRLTDAALDVRFSKDAQANRRAALLSISEASTLALTELDGRLVRGTEGVIVLTGGMILRGPAGEVRLEPLTLQPADADSGARFVISNAAGAALFLRDVKVGFDRAGARLLIEASELVVSDNLAQALGNAHLAGLSIGSLSAETLLNWTGGEAPPSDQELFDQAKAGGLRTTCGNSGPDVIVGDLPAVANYTSIGGIDAFAVGTDSCNIGDTPLEWISGENRHPVIGQNMYRLKDGRFEQVGMSWLKHGFTALAQNICDCGCNDPGTGALLGVGCSDPYSSGLNGSQARLGPRFEVNPHTGYFLYPFTAQDQTGDSIYKRCQVAVSDLDPAQDGGGLYFVEGQYVTPDDAAAGNQDNNLSYREATISGSGQEWDASVSGMPATVREQPAIRAWKANDPAVVETDVRVPDEGLILLAAKATDLGGGLYHYEYAVQNLNSDRAVGSFHVPIDPAAQVSNIGFHDVNYHSGEPFDGTDWPGVVTNGFVSWSTEDASVNPDANALRWGTLYNFRFDADVPPQTTAVQFGLFKPGSPSIAYAVTTGPEAGLIDCNSNGVSDFTDVSGGTSQDCDGDSIPDECQGYPEPTLTTVEVVTGLESPVGLVSPNGDFDRMFVLEQNTGRIKIISNGAILPTPFIDIGSLISSGGERGLLGLAFHPKFLTNGYFFVDYTNTAGNTVIARYSVSGNPNIADPNSAVILKTITQDFANHNGGQLTFGPDGYLYASLGDGGSGGDPNDRAQDINVLLGKILRLDVDAGPPYIPPDNPFVGTDGLDEIWAYGVRNPWRISFDRLTGDLFIADVGQGAWEEVDFQPAGSAGGENYGWRCYEGDAEYNTTGCASPDTMVFPILTYEHSGGSCSITGGFMYRGCEMPGLHGTYFYADYCGDWVRSFRYQPGDPIPPAWQDRTAELGPFDGAIVSFGEDAAGELYIVSSGGTIYKIVPDLTIPTECGNGILETGEECDDGNTTDGDGCSSTCTIEGGNNDYCAGAIDVCPGTYTGDTSTATVDGSSSCGNSSASNDRWYRYVPGADGSATFALCSGTSYDAVLSVHSGCTGTSANELGCDDDGCGTTGGPSTVTINVTANQSYFIRISGYSSSSGAYTLNVTGPDCASGTCGDGTVDPGEDCEPPNTPTCDATCHTISCAQPLFADNFETDQGWTAGSSGATTGFWQRGVPVDDTSWGYDPATDSDGSGQCYLTQNEFGNTDVDDGSVFLVSPAIDMSAGGVTISYDYYLNLTVADGNDALVLDISSNDGGTWTEIARHDANGGLNWHNDTITQAQLDSAGVAMTSTMRLRFTANDAGTASVVESGIDAVQVTVGCIDCNSNGISDTLELTAGTAADCNVNGVPDDCDIAGGTSTDCDGGPVGDPAGGQAIVSTICFGCHNTDGSGGPGYPGPSLRNHTRIFIRNKLTPPTDHPGGAHPEFTEQDYADLEAFLSDVGGRPRPDLIPDECELTPDCNSNGVADGCDLAGGTAVDYDQSGILDVCEEFCSTTMGDVDGDCDVDLFDFAGTQRCYTGDIGSGPVLYADGCACLDADADGDVDRADYDAFAVELYGPGDMAPGCP